MANLSFDAEIDRLHDFFARWWRGEAADLAEVSEALAPAFYLVSTDGSVMDRGVLVDYLRDSRTDEGVPIEIEIRNATMRSGSPLLVCTYEEHQIKRGIPSSRMSTAVMRTDRNGPGGWSWLAVHETWLAPPPALRPERPQAGS